MALTKNNIQKVEDATSMSYTPSSVSDAYLLVWVLWEDISVPFASVTDVDFGGTSLTKQRGEQGNEATATCDTEVWYLKNPGTSTQTITVTGLTGINGAAIVAMTIGGADGTTFIEADNGEGGTGGGANLDVTSLTDDALMMCAYNGNLAPGLVFVSGQTLDAHLDYPTADAEIASTIRGTAGIETFEWDPHSSRRSLVGIAIKPAAGGGAGTLSPVGGAHSHLADVGTFVQHHALGPIPTLHGQSADSAGLAQLHELSVVSDLHGHVAGQASFALGGTLAIADGAHSHGADFMAIAQVHFFGVRSAASAHLAAVATFITQSEIIIAAARHDHVSDEVIFGAGLGPPPERLVQPTRAARVIEPGAAPRIIQGKR